MDFNGICDINIDFCSKVVLIQAAGVAAYCGGDLSLCTRITITVSPCNRGNPEMISTSNDYRITLFSSQDFPASPLFSQLGIAACKKL